MTKDVRCVIIYTALKQAFPPTRRHNLGALSMKKFTAATITICTIFGILFGGAQLVHIFGDNHAMVTTLRNLALLFAIPAGLMTAWYIKKTATTSPAY